MTTKLQKIIGLVYDVGPKVDKLPAEPAPPLRAKRLFIDEKRKNAEIISEEEVVIREARYAGLFDVYSYEKASESESNQYLYRFRIAILKKKKNLLAFKFEAYQNKETGSLFIENFENYNWDTNMSVMKEFLQTCFSKIMLTLEISHIVLELDRKRLTALDLKLFEDEVAELGYSREPSGDSAPKSDRAGYEKDKDGAWTIFVYSKDDPTDSDDSK